MALGFLWYEVGRTGKGQPGSERDDPVGPSPCCGIRERILGNEEVGMLGTFLISKLILSSIKVASLFS